MNAESALQTLEKNGHIPETRMDSALEAGERIKTMMESEKRGRAQRRALVKGLVDGNPPYRVGDQRAAGRANQCNVNWRVSEYYLNQARSAFSDVFLESPTYATVRTGFGNSSERERWSGIITEEYDRMQRKDPTWDYTNAISQYEMILYGCGPIFFEDDKDWRTTPVLCGNLLVPDFTYSDVCKWEEAVIVRDYLAPELYDFIRRDKAASEVGWDVQATRKAIMMAHPKYQEGGQYSSWEWHQQQLKNKSHWYGSQSKVIQCVHYFFQEFPLPGEDEPRVTHCILINPEATQNILQGYLFQHIGRFKSWLDIVHPMYYDNDGGGYHHSVTGLGVKMYSAMEYQNRLLCNIADKVAAPKLLFKPTTANANEQLNIIQFGDYGKVPPGFDTVQMPTASFIDENLAFHREMTRLVSSNLSQYSPQMTKESGNPITAYEASIRASEQARLGKTQLNHYYAQMDRLHAVRYKRASNTSLTGFMPGGHEARAFQRRCMERGVPKKALEEIESVKSTRIIGQGSQFMRSQALTELMALYPTLPTDAGRNNLLSDYIASKAGQSMVDRYNPPIQLPSEIDDQRALATLQIAASKDGIAPVVTGNQNHYVFASLFLQAAATAAASLAQGGNPFEVYQFIDTIGPATIQHIDAVSRDPMRKQDAQVMQKQWKELAALHDKLGAQLQKQAQQQQEQAAMQQRAMAMQNGQDPELQMKAAETEAKIAMQQRKTDAALAQKQQKHNQSLAINDAKAANSITTSSVVTANDIQLARKKASEKPAKKD